MAWIRTVPPEEATGLLARLYREAIDRAGKVFHVLRLQSPRPEEEGLDVFAHRQAEGDVFRAGVSILHPRFETGILLLLAQAPQGLASPGVLPPAQLDPPGLLEGLPQGGGGGQGDQPPRVDGRPGARVATP